LATPAISGTNPSAAIRVMVEFAVITCGGRIVADAARWAQT